MERKSHRGECPSCKTVLRVSEDYLGRYIECPICKNQFIIPLKAEPVLPVSMPPIPPPIPKKSSQAETYVRKFVEEEKKLGITFSPLIFCIFLILVSSLFRLFYYFFFKADI